MNIQTIGNKIRNIADIVKERDAKASDKQGAQEMVSEGGHVNPEPAVSVKNVKA